MHDESTCLTKIGIPCEYPVQLQKCIWLKKGKWNHLSVPDISYNVNNLVPLAGVAGNNDL